ncbi:MAG: hypothetical protein KF778_06610 [Rhodocyclaceae bacterium]|nr:hypothetical protein [Rhodocyclaceae bacterium]MBX3668058.1 hypothetical protein [Rhodocyclaceae bacterium]
MTDEEFFNIVERAIHPDFLCRAHGGYLVHAESHHDGSTSRFRLKASAKMVAFSLDKRGENPFPVVAAGMNARNDLTVICRGTDASPLLFAIECKASENPRRAQYQIECGIAFGEYLFKLIRFSHGHALTPRCFGVAAYRPKSPPKGTTRPSFFKQGKGNTLRANWPIDVDLPISELIRAAQAIQ